MSEPIDLESQKEKTSKLPMIVLGIIGVGVIGYCIFGAIMMLNPNLLSSVREPTIPSVLEPLLIENGTAQPTPSKRAQKLLDDSSQWNLVLDETFDTNINNWNMGAGSTDEIISTLDFKNGKYLWDITSKNTIMASVGPYELEPLTDFRLSADVKLTSGTYKPVYGIVFRSQTGGEYFFGIYGEGFMVEKRYNENFARIIENVKSPAISPEESNRLTVIAKGSYFVFLINDQFVGEMIDEEIKEGSVGFGVVFYHVDLQNSFEFDNFSLQTP